MSTLKTNAIQTTSGKPILNSTGSILQVVQTVKSNTFSTASTTYTDVTGLSATITPSSTGSKILVLCDIKLGHTVDYDPHFRIVRGGTAIHVGDANGTRPRASGVFNVYSSSGTYGYSCGSAVAHALDSPSTTSAVTYKIQVATYSTRTVYVNRSNNFQAGTTYDTLVPSSITLMEISG
jgi:hypothetical protein